MLADMKMIDWRVERRLDGRTNGQLDKYRSTISIQKMLLLLIELYQASWLFGYWLMVI